MPIRPTDLVNFGDYENSDDAQWERRIGPEANASRKLAVRCGRSARWFLLAYVGCLLLWAALNGFRTTGERFLPNVVLLASALAVTAVEVVLTAREQIASRRLRRQVNAVLNGADGPRSKDVIAGDQLMQMQLFDQWTARFRLRWYDGTLQGQSDRATPTD